MSISASTIFEIRTAGNDTNGGGFVEGAAGTDYSQQDTKNTAGNDISTTDAVGNGTSTLTSATANFQASIVGNIIYLQGGTAPLAAGWYQVTARASTTSITLDRTVSTGTGITMNIGGALASLGQAGASSGGVTGLRYYIKAGTYTISSTSNNVSGGCFTIDPAWVQGYQTARNDYGTPPVLQANGVITSFAVIGVGFSGSRFENITVDGNNRTNSRGFTGSSQAGVLYRCNAINCTNNGFNLSNTVAIQCTATGCSSQAAFSFFGGIARNCVAYSNTIGGFNAGTAATKFEGCVAYSNTGVGFNLAVGGCVASGCVAYANTTHGFSMGAVAGISLFNCIAETNTTTGFNFTGNSLLMQRCAAYNNGTNFNIGTGKFVNNLNPTTGTGSFFTNAAGADFSLNNTASAGAALRGTGYPGVLPIGGTGYIDVGALQHQDTGGGGGGATSSAYFG